MKNPLFTYRHDAEDLMRGNYINIFVVLLIFGIVTSTLNRLGERYAFDSNTAMIAVTHALSSTFSMVANILLFIVSGPIAYATAKMFIKITENTKVEIEDILKTSVTDNLGRSILHAFFLSIFIFLWSLFMI